MWSALRIAVLKENTGTDPQVQPGHGLALLVEYGETRVLFDTGPDDTVVANARALNAPLRPLTALVLSHGHYDHTGGLAASLDAVGPTRVLAHPGVFDRTYAEGAGGPPRYIGMPHTQEEYASRGARWELSPLPVAVGKGLITTGEVPQIAPGASVGQGLLREGPSGVGPDTFVDDVSLVGLLEGCSAVITGCGHAGLLNILRQAEVVASGRRPRVVVGGLHWGATPEEQVVAFAAEAYARGVRTLLPGHCTGQRAIEVLQGEFPGTVIPLSTGQEIRVDRDGSAKLLGA